MKRDNTADRMRRWTFAGLLAGGNVDFSTPAEYATQELLPSLSRGKQVIIAGAFR